MILFKLFITFGIFLDKLHILSERRDRRSHAIVQFFQIAGHLFGFSLVFIHFKELYRRHTQKNQYTGSGNCQNTDQKQIFIDKSSIK